ncbi:hypothetical protein [Ferruginibacter albus]|uniref:hypothetical protein n=1 Tax=Ferruginibacter albus TaxID=2875540 RepID=UPI001CC75669|nr:hypothetical protein [Ferruginibacter albus]UAY52702.1 hypothetical protein K9M53_03175 [Ferruginibacter albus]
MAKYLIILSLILTYMGKIVIPEIRDNYPLYTQLLKERKSTNERTIDVSSPKKSNRNFLIAENISIKHSALNNNIEFIAEVKVDNHKYFLFKLRCKSLSETPFFRYDSDGCAHRNYDESIPFDEQLITTPHFNYFNQDGVLMAYKTEQLKDTNECEALQDINLCMSHYCMESNLRLNDEDFPSISILANTLQLPTVKDDPNSGVQFI